MNFWKKLLLVFALCVSDMYAQEHAYLSVIPQPSRVEIQDGTFVIHNKTGFLCDISNGKAENTAEFLKGYLKKHYGIPLRFSPAKGRCNLVFDLHEKSVLSSGENAGYLEGAYSLKITPQKIIITSTNEQGLFYGMQTLIQLLPLNGNDSFSIPCVEIEDSPRFPYRGMHLDVVRHIFPVEYIKKYIDYLALHKMNYFHWHLTDDQGWRMESKSHPRLNEKGAYRAGSIIGMFPGTGVDSTRYGGYYTIEELKEVVDYAAKRYITVVPEIDIPGHSMAILSAYPQFGTEPEKPVEPAITWGIFNRANNVLAPGEELFAFLEDVFNELMDVFPGKYIHIGCDECAHKWWKASEATQQFIKEHNLKDENGLQHYFTRRVSDIVAKRGRIAIGWDEMIESGLPDGVVVMSWRNAENAYKAAQQGHEAILTPSRFSYFNRMQKENEDSLCHKSILTSLDKVYKFEPVPDTLSAEVAGKILGGQGCMWTEYFQYISSVEYGIFPRMSAIAEVYWSQKQNKNWPLFLLKLQDQYKRYEIWGANSCRYVFEHECIPTR